MTHTHDHANCKHECVHYCPVCNLTYCCKCGQTWSNQTNYHWTYPYTWSPITTPCYPTCGVSGTGDVIPPSTTLFCSHTHQES